MRRTTLLLAIALVAAGMGAAPAAAQTPAEVAAEAEFLDLINDERIDEGLAPLSVYWDLLDDARAQSQFQADGNCPGEATICHNDDLGSVTTGWFMLGENVGVGPNAPVLHDAFMDSPPHRANILESRYDYAGIGVVIDEGDRMFVTVVFMDGPPGLPALPPGGGEGEGGDPMDFFAAGADRLGQQNPATGVWSLSMTGEDNSFYYGVPSDIPVACDWDGDAIDTVGLYRSWTGFLHLRNTNSQGFSDIEIFYGVPSDLPVCGDWDGDGVDSIGIFRPEEGRFYLRNTNTQGFADLTLDFGQPGDHPVAGDWDGDGVHTVGVYRPATGQILLAAGNDDPAIAQTIARPDISAGDLLVCGDWDADGRDSFGFYRPGEGAYHLANDPAATAPDAVIPFGTHTDNAVVGQWEL